MDQSHTTPFIASIDLHTITIKGEIPRDPTIPHPDKDPLYHLWKPIQDRYLKEYGIHIVMTNCRLHGEVHIRLDINQVSLLEEIYYLKTEHDWQRIVQKPHKLDDYAIKKQRRILQLASCDYVEALTHYINEKFQCKTYPVNLTAGITQQYANFAVISGITATVG